MQEDSLGPILLVGQPLPFDGIHGGLVGVELEGSLVNQIEDAFGLGHAGRDGAEADCRPSYIPSSDEMVVFALCSRFLASPSTVARACSAWPASRLDETLGLGETSLQVIHLDGQDPALGVGVHLDTGAGGRPFALQGLSCGFQVALEDIAVGTQLRQAAWEGVEIGVHVLQVIEHGAEAGLGAHAVTVDCSVRALVRSASMGSSCSSAM